jgi:hypothetical protein
MTSTFWQIFSRPNNMPVEVLITICAHPRLQRLESRIGMTRKPEKPERLER